jgi:BirA family biotin operon repressor/biotin-[acetyl-CoA-carboxylase] ligase
MIATGGPLHRLAPFGGPRFARIQNIVAFRTASSTNEVARELIERALAESEELLPTVLVTARQTAGRGRAGRTWTATPGDPLALSLVVPWPEGPGRIRVPLEFGIALASGLSSTFGIVVRLKWPNDLLVGRKKLGGILVEAKAGEDGEGYAAVGIGLNRCATREELDAAGLVEATSLAIEGAPPASLAGDAPILHVLSILEAAIGTPGGDLCARFAAVSAHRTGEPVTVREGTRTVTGEYLGVTPDGLLRLGTATGEETVVSGDVIAF